MTHQKASEESYFFEIGDGISSIPKTPSILDTSFISKVTEEPRFMILSKNTLNRVSKRERDRSNVATRELSPVAANLRYLQEVQSQTRAAFSTAVPQLKDRDSGHCCMYTNDNQRQLSMLAAEPLTERQKQRLSGCCANENICHLF
jgi:hypothetical protein